MDLGGLDFGVPSNDTTTSTTTNTNTHSNITSNTHSNIQNINDIPMMNISKSSGLDMLNIEGLDEYQIKEKVDSIIIPWTKGMNEPKNIYLLLASLHEIWTKSNYEYLKEISIKSMMDDTAVFRKTYKTVLKMFHTDKVKGYTFKERWACEQLYHIVAKANEDYINKFENN